MLVVIQLDGDVELSDTIQWDDGDGNRFQEISNLLLLFGNHLGWFIEWTGILKAVEDKLREATSDRQRERFEGYFATIRSGCL